MSRIQIGCDDCGDRVSLAVRQNHQARQLLEQKGWISVDGGGNRWGRSGTVKRDYCPKCRRY